MTGDDLKRMQDHFLEISKKILLEQGRLHPVGFVVTLRKHVDKLFESGYGLEFLDPKECLHDGDDDTIAVLIVDLLMDWKRLYHAVMALYPQVRDVLPQMIALGESIDVDDAHMRVMRAFLRATELDEKDVIGDVMRQICDKVDAFACAFHTEAWLRNIEAGETAESIRKNAPDSLGQDRKSVEVIVSSMETYDFTRMLMTPIHRDSPNDTDPAARDVGSVIGFGDPTTREDTPDRKEIDGRLVHFLKPLAVAS